VRNVIFGYSAGIFFVLLLSFSDILLDLVEVLSEVIADKTDWKFMKIR
jgi:hypothetical protein